MAGQNGKPRASVKLLGTLVLGLALVCCDGTGVTHRSDGGLASAKRYLLSAQSEPRPEGAVLGYFGGLAALIGRFKHQVDGGDNQLAASQPDDPFAS